MMGEEADLCRFKGGHFSGQITFLKSRIALPELG